MSGPTSTVATSPLAKDALLEVVNIGSGNALSSLSRLLGGARLMLSVPELVTAAAVPALDGLDTNGLAVSMDVIGALTCRLLVLFDDPSALRLAAELLSRDAEASFFGEEEESAVVEAVNIISCSFLGAMASLMHGELVPSPPVAVYGRLDQVLGEALTEGAWALTNRFDATSGAFSGRFFLIGDPLALGRMLQALGVDGTRS